VLSDLGKLETKAARLILGAAVMDDIIGMLLLAVVVALTAGGSMLSIVLLGVMTILFTLFMIFLAPRLVRRATRRVDKLSTRNAPLIVALILCLGLSFAAERLGLAAIIGAFFAGLMFAELAPQWDLAVRVDAINEFLAPFFFFVMGARLDLHGMTGSLWLTAAIITALAILSKIVGCGLPALPEGRRVAWQVGVGMSPRGEVGLIIALMGLNLKAIQSDAYAVVVFMSAITTLFAPPVLRLLFRKAE
jgi:Kef-type K+ transport system membrane component KefB